MRLHAYPVEGDESDFTYNLDLISPLKFLFYQFSHLLVIILVLFTGLMLIYKSFISVLSLLYIFIGLHLLINHDELVRVNGAKILHRVRFFNFIIMLVLVAFSSPLFPNPQLADNIFWETWGLFKPQDDRSRSFLLIFLFFILQLQDWVYRHPYQDAYLAPHHSREVHLHRRSRAFRYVENVHLKRRFGYHYALLQSRLLKQRMQDIYDELMVANQKTGIDLNGAKHVAVDDANPTEDNKSDAGSSSSSTSNSSLVVIDQDTIEMNTVLEATKTTLKDHKISVYNNEELGLYGAIKTGATDHINDEDETAFFKALFEKDYQKYDMVHSKTASQLNRGGLSLTNIFKHARTGSAGFFKRASFANLFARKSQKELNPSQSQAEGVNEGNDEINTSQPVSEREEKDDASKKDGDDGDKKDDDADSAKSAEGEQDDGIIKANGVVQYIRDFLDVKMIEHELYYQVGKSREMRRLEHIHKRSLLYLSYLALLSNMNQIVYMLFLLIPIMNPSLVTAPYLVAFAYAMLQNPMPMPNFWRRLTYYTLILLVVLLAYQLPLFCGTPPYSFYSKATEYCTMVPSEDLGGRIDFLIGIHKFSCTSSFHMGVTDNIGLMLVLYCALLMEKYYLKLLGVWDFVEERANLYNHPAFRQEDKMMPERPRHGEGPGAAPGVLRVEEARVGEEGIILPHATHADPARVHEALPEEQRRALQGRETRLSARLAHAEKGRQFVPHRVLPAGSAVRSDALLLQGLPEQKERDSDGLLRPAAFLVRAHHRARGHDGLDRGHSRHPAHAHHQLPPQGSTTRRRCSPKLSPRTTWSRNPFCCALRRWRTSKPGSKRCRRASTSQSSSTTAA